MSHPHDWLRVTTDVPELELARRLAAEADEARCAALFEGLSQLAVYNVLDFKRIVSKRPAVFLPRLQALVQSGEVTDESVGAAILLGSLRESVARPHLVRTLVSGTNQQILRIVKALSSLALCDWDFDRSSASWLLAEPGCESAIRKLFTHPASEVVEDIVFKRDVLPADDAVPLLQQALEHVSADKRLMVQQLLAKLILDPEQLVQALQMPPESSDEKLVIRHESILEDFAHRGTREQKVLARDWLQRRLQSWPDGGLRGYTTSRMQVIDAIAATISPAEADELLEWSKRETGYYGQRFFVAWAKLVKGESRERILTMLRGNETWPASFAVEAALEAFAGTNDEELARAIGEAAQNFQGSGIKSCCKALLAIGGEVALGELRQVAQRLDPAEQRKFLPPPDDDGEKVREQVRAAGVLSDQELDAAWQTVASSNDKSLESIFSAARRQVWFDAETGYVPCRHDELLEDFASQSAGRFVPESISQVWHRIGDEDFEAPYTLRFEHQGRVYIGEIRNFGDWYDVERIAQMIDRALADAQCLERFIHIARQDQVAEFVFACPQKFAPLAAARNIVVAKDLNAPRQLGVEYENYVRSQLPDDGDDELT